MRKIITLLFFILIANVCFGSWLVNKSPRMDFKTAVSLGMVDGWSQIDWIMHNSLVGTSEELIWEGPTATYPYLSAAQQLTVSSSSANDTIAGTGLRTVEIIGLDGSWNQVSETIELNGQTGVTTVNSYLRIQGYGFVGKTAGSGGTNAGTIYIGHGTITAGVPATVLNVIIAGHGRSHAGFIAIPAGHKGLIPLITVTSESSKFVELYGLSRPFGGVFTKSFFSDSSGSPLVIGDGYSLVAEPKTDICVHGLAALTTTDVKITTTLIFVRNP